MKKKYYLLLLTIGLSWTVTNCFAQQETLFKDLNHTPRSNGNSSSSTIAQPSPIITGITLSSGTIVIKGSGFSGVQSVTIGGTAAPGYVVNDSHTITVTTALNPATGVTVSMASGDANYLPATGTYSFVPAPGYTAPVAPAAAVQPDETTTKAVADFTIPEVGQSNLNIIVTPTFTLNRVFYDKKIAVSGLVWGNTFGLDSTKSKLGAKLLLPQSSMFGMSFSFQHILWFSTKDAALGVAADMNFLYKKVNFLDTASRQTTNFSPFVLHPKIGLTAAFFDSSIQLSLYYNILTVQSENDSFKKFFVTDKKAFVYPEFNISGVFYVDQGQTQSIKIGLNMLINNKDAKILSGSTDNMIPYLKIGLVSKL